ncbi:MAG: DUF2589 domain-containing protein [Pseudomonadales bacterium]|nr:DUF2589 domain-containing protein [Pseudomonadales bacterium]
MIRFQELMLAVQKSIHSAAQAVESEGFKHIDKFFDEVPSSKYKEQQENSKTIDDAHKALAAGDADKASALLKELNSAPDGSSPMGPEESTIHRPKMVAMAFPNQDANGVGTTIVNVPLITLCPISSPRIKEVHFSADLEVTADDNDELYIAFRSPKVNGGASTVTKDTSNTHLEITLVGHEPPEGLQKIIEGYEKALRAQIPG